MKKVELKALSKSELKKEIYSLQKEYFNLKIQKFSGQIKDTSQFEKLRKKIARANTFLKVK
jgi:ribosomal protein L29